MSNSITIAAIEELAILYEQINLIQDKCNQIINIRNLPAPEPIFPDLTLVKASVNSARKVSNSLTNIITYLETKHVGAIVRHDQHHEQQSALRRLEQEREPKPERPTSLQCKQEPEPKCDECRFLLDRLEQQYDPIVRKQYVRDGFEGIKRVLESVKHDNRPSNSRHGTSSLDPSRQHADDAVDERVGCCASDGTCEPQ